jgi:hypothetical protein
MSKELVHYDTMRRAIDAAHSIDEILPIRHKAAQLAAAAKIAKDFESKRKCRAIRVRAERRAGELLADIPKAPGPGRGKKTPHDAESFHKAPSEPVSIKIEPVRKSRRAFVQSGFNEVPRITEPFDRAPRGPHRSLQIPKSLFR